MSKFNIAEKVLIKNSTIELADIKHKSKYSKCFGEIISINKLKKIYKVKILSNGCFLSKMKFHKNTIKDVYEDNLIKLFECDRVLYSPSNKYTERPEHISDEQTISAIEAHRKAVNLLSDKLVPGANILDVGCGSGILICEFAKRVLRNNNDNIVVGIDIKNNLVQYAIKRVLEDIKLKRWYNEGRIIILKSNAWKFPEDNLYKKNNFITENKLNPKLNFKEFDGGSLVLLINSIFESYYQKKSKTFKSIINQIRNITKANNKFKFDGIHIGAGMNKIPKNLYKLLKPKGYICGPIGEQKTKSLQWRCCISEDNCSYESGPYWSYVPLIKEDNDKIGGQKKSRRKTTFKKSYNKRRRRSKRKTTLKKKSKN